MALSTSSPAEEAQLLRMAGAFLSRMGTDPAFAQSFDRDPASALQELFPELRFAPKASIAAEIASANQSFLRLASASQGQDIKVLGGIASAVAAVARTSAVRAVASAVVSGVASAVVSHFLKTIEAEPAPE